jgi:hypothetical protein
MQQLTAPNMEIQALLPQRCGCEDVRPERCVECSAKLICTDPLLSPMNPILDFGVRERNSGMTSQGKAIFLAGFEYLMTAGAQAQNFAQVDAKIRNRIGIELTRYPQVLVQNRLQIAGHYGLQNGIGIELPPAS